ncbi:hypothetical protein EDB85DRAFT_836881 [Lactarius pseudohatsudake]|nr:hypothetical protein EDB85DRAFT_836881 [Lactarius pseudohatsudake]
MATATATATAGEAEEQRTRRAARSQLGFREIFEHPSRPSLDNLHVPALTMHHMEPPLPPRFPPRDDHACSLFSDTRPARRTSHAGSSCIVLQQYEERFAAKLLALRQDVLFRLMGLPDSKAASIMTAQLTHTELLAHTVTKADAKHDGDEFGSAGAAGQCEPKRTSCWRASPRPRRNATSCAPRWTRSRRSCCCVRRTPPLRRRSPWSWERCCRNGWPADVRCDDWNACLSWRS